jgi:hypothetical protein
VLRVEFIVTPLEAQHPISSIVRAENANGNLAKGLSVEKGRYSIPVVVGCKNSAKPEPKRICRRQRGGTGDVETFVENFREGRTVDDAD